MPLIKSPSKKAAKKNMEMESMPESGPQNLAIAMDVQRRNKRKMADGGRVARDQEPVELKKNPKLGDRYEGDNNSGMPSRKPDNSRPAQSEIMSSNMAQGSSLTPSDSSLEAIKKEKYLDDNAVKLADGGEVCLHCEGRGHMMPPAAQEPDEMDSDSDDHATGSVAEQILSKQRFQKLAMGGEIDDPFDNGEGISHFQEEGPGVRMKHNINAREYNAGDDRQISSQPEDSNEKGDEREDESENKDDMVGAIRKKMMSGRR